MKRTEPNEVMRELRARARTETIIRLTGEWVGGSIVANTAHSAAVGVVVTKNFDATLPDPRKLPGTRKNVLSLPRKRIRLQYRNACILKVFIENA